jgi:hypothetical protein
MPRRWAMVRAMTPELSMIWAVLAQYRSEFDLIKALCWARTPSRVPGILYFISRVSRVAWPGRSWDRRVESISAGTRGTTSHHMCFHVWIREHERCMYGWIKGYWLSKRHVVETWKSLTNCCVKWLWSKFYITLYQMLARLVVTAMMPFIFEILDQSSYLSTKACRKLWANIYGAVISLTL